MGIPGRLSIWHSSNWYSSNVCSTYNWCGCRENDSLLTKTVYFFLFCSEYKIHDIHWPPQDKLTFFGSAVFEARQLLGRHIKVLKMYIVIWSTCSCGSEFLQVLAMTSEMSVLVSSNFSCPRQKCWWETGRGASRMVLFGSLCTSPVVINFCFTCNTNSCL